MHLCSWNYSSHVGGSLKSISLSTRWTMIAESSMLFPVAFPSSSMSLSRWRQKNSGKSWGRMSTFTSWINPSIALWRITCNFHSSVYWQHIMWTLSTAKNQCITLCPHTVYCTYLIVAAGPKESRMHDCSDKAAASWREASLWKRNCATTLRFPQCIASLCGVMAEPKRRVINVICWHQVSCTRLNYWVDLGTRVRKVFSKFSMAYIDCEWPDQYITVTSCQHLTTTPHTHNSHW